MRRHRRLPPPQPPAAAAPATWRQKRRGSSRAAACARQQLQLPAPLQGPPLLPPWPRALLAHARGCLRLLRTLWLHLRAASALCRAPHPPRPFPRRAPRARAPGSAQRQSWMSQRCRGSRPAVAAAAAAAAAPASATPAGLAGRRQHPRSRARAAILGRLGGRRPPLQGPAVAVALGAGWCRRRAAEARSRPRGAVAALRVSAQLLAGLLGRARRRRAVRGVTFGRVIPGRLHLCRHRTGVRRRVPASSVGVTPARQLPSSCQGSAGERARSSSPECGRGRLPAAVAAGCASLLPQQRMALRGRQLLLSSTWASGTWGTCTASPATTASGQFRTLCQPAPSAVGKLRVTPAPWWSRCGQLPSSCRRHRSQSRGGLHRAASSRRRRPTCKQTARTAAGAAETRTAWPPEGRRQLQQQPLWAAGSAAPLHPSHRAALAVATQPLS
jgi:hypothetical protein